MNKVILSILCIVFIVKSNAEITQNQFEQFCQIYDQDHFAKQLNLFKRAEI